MSPTKCPTLPPLHFHECNSSVCITNALHESADHSNASFHNLPDEVLAQCLTSYADWGTLAKLSTVRKSWSSLVPSAADYGGRASKWELGNALLDGTHGLAPNPSLALRYLQELAGVTLTADGNICPAQESEPFAPAMRKLATCYLSGTGAAQDAAVGLGWLKAAYVVGSDVDAAHEVGVIYEFGREGVDIDVVEAAEWFEKSAKGGHVEGMAEYALCCELGCGREQNDEEAMEWYVKAAEAGHIIAKYSVGEAFEEARGVPQSDSEACLWYYKAAKEGDEDSKRALNRLSDIARIVVPGWEGVLNE